VYREATHLTNRLIRLVNCRGIDLKRTVFSKQQIEILLISLTMLFEFSCGEDDLYPVIKCTDEESCWSPDWRYIPCFYAAKFII
jgi:hypothetical protein